MNYLNKLKSCGQFLKKFSDRHISMNYCSLEIRPAKEKLSSAHLQKILPVNPLVSD